MRVAERVLGRAVAGNNRRMAARALDVAAPNPRPIAEVAWTQDLNHRHPAVRAEWDAFVTTGGRLPHIEDLLLEDQGAQGAWRAGLLVSRGRPVHPLADAFPETMAALAVVPGLWSALWSLLEPGTELPEHRGPNAGMLRYHLGVVCGDDTALRVGGVTTAYREGEGLLFDDTAPHQAWNRGSGDRVTLFCEVLRPSPRLVGLANLGVQSAIALDPRYRGARGRAAEWHHALHVPARGPGAASCDA